MPVHALRCFGATATSGNPALVVERDPVERAPVERDPAGDHPADPAARAAFAARHATTTVFLDHDARGPVLDYYYPHARSPLCLHATLAAAAVLAARGALPPRAHTALRGQPLALRAHGGRLFVGLAPEVAATPPDAAAVAAALLGTAPCGAPRVASVGSPKLLVEVADRATLYRLAPDLPALTAWGQAQGINGLYVYCALADGQFEGRNFNHLDPAAEDSATGVAAGALCALLGHALTLRQGAATGRDCLLHAHPTDGLVWVGGTAVPVDS